MCLETQPFLAARALSTAFTFVCRALRHGEVFRGLPVTVDREGESGRRAGGLVRSGRRRRL